MDSAEFVEGLADGFNDQKESDVVEDIEMPSINKETLGRRYNDKLLVTSLVIEIHPDGTTEFKEVSLKNLRDFVNDQAAKYDCDGISLTEKDNSISLIRPRDLRRLEFSLNPLEEPTFLVRRHAVLLSLDPLRAIGMIYFPLIMTMTMWL